MSTSKPKAQVRTYHEVSVVTELKTLDATAVETALEKALTKLGKVAAKKFQDFTQDGQYALVLENVSHQVIVGEPRFCPVGAIDGTVPGVIVSVARVDRDIA